MPHACAHVSDDVSSREAVLTLVANRLRAARRESSGYEFAGALAELWITAGLDQVIPRRDVLFHVGRNADLPPAKYGRREVVERAWETAVASAGLLSRADEIPHIAHRLVGRAGHWQLQWRRPDDDADQALLVRYSSEPGARSLPWHIRLVWRRDEYDLTTLRGRFGFLFPVLPLMVTLVVLLPVVGMSFFILQSAPTAKNAISMASIILGIALVYRFALAPMNSMFRYRSLLLGDFASDQVLIDLQKTSEVDRFARVISVSGSCIFCGGDVSLDDGWREFHRPIVGRCRQSPIEHVFTFDRAVMEGEPLRKGSSHFN